MTRSPRNGYIDFIKGIAILLVLVGHAIQYCSGSEYFLQREYYDNPLFKFIYSFHMPLFMAVSGYLLQCTLSSRTEWDVALRRLRQLMLPILSFGILAFVIKWAVRPVTDVLECVKELWRTCIGNLWFLWALLYNQLLLLLIRRMGDRIWMYAVVGVIIYFIPDSNYIPVRYTFLYPFLVLGYMIGKYSLVRIYEGKVRFGITIVMLALYVGARCAVLASFGDAWDGTILGGVLRTIRRQFVALFALGWILPLLYELYNALSTRHGADFIMKAGRNSLGIYYFQTLIFILVSRVCHLLPSLGTWGALIGGIVITVECLLLAQWSNRYGIMRLLVWGGK